MKPLQTAAYGTAAAIGAGAAWFASESVDGGYAAFLSAPGEIASYGPLASSVVAALSALASVHALLSRPASQADVEAVGLTAAAARQAGEEATRSARVEGAAIRDAAHRAAQQAEQRADARHQELLEALRSERQHVALPQPLLDALAARTDPALNFDEQLGDLIARFDAAHELIRMGETTSNLGSFVEAVRKRIADKAAAGDLDGASNDADQALTRWQQDEAERRAASSAAGLALIETAIDTARARGDAEAVARHLVLEVAISHPGQPAFTPLMARARKYQSLGETSARQLDLQIAAALYQMAADRTEAPARRIEALSERGTLLKQLGERGLPGAFEDALGAYEDVLSLTPREGDRFGWAGAINNLGTVYQSMGERGTAGLYQKAVACFQDALDIFAERPHTGTWVSIQNNLGVALLRQAQFEGRDTLDEARAAFAEALKAVSPEADGQVWAVLNNNLGSALVQSGNKGNAEDYLDTVEAFRRCQRVMSRTAAPMAWAQSEENIAAALERYAAAKANSRDELRQALAAARGALEVCRQGDATYYVDKTESLIANIEGRLAGSR